MKILLVSESDGGGGAGIAAKRLFDALSKFSDLEVYMYVNRKFSDHKRVFSDNSLIYRLVYAFARRVDNLLTSFLRSKDDYFLGVGLFSVEMILGSLKRKIVELEPDIINLHWVHGGFLGIYDIEKLLSNSCFITLHDEWYLNGLEHYQKKDVKLSWMRKNLSSYLRNRKIRLYKKKNVSFIALNSWMKQKILEAGILERNIHQIFNCLDITRYKVNEYKKEEENDIVNLIVGAQAMDMDKRKGMDLLLQALTFLSDKEKKNLQLCVFGSSVENVSVVGGVVVNYVGEIKDENELIQIYNEGDVFLLPSRIDNLPNTVVEALCCGCFIVAFNVGGLPDLVIDQKIGYLAVPEDCQDLANGIRVAVHRHKNSVRRSSLKISEKFGYKTIADKYSKVFDA